MERAARGPAGTHAWSTRKRECPGKVGGDAGWNLRRKLAADACGAARRCGTHLACCSSGLVGACAARYAGLPLTSTLYWVGPCAVTAGRQAGRRTRQQQRTFASLPHAATTTDDAPGLCAPPSCRANRPALGVSASRSVAGIAPASRPPVAPAAGAAGSEVGMLYIGCSGLLRPARCWLCWRLAGAPPQPPSTPFGRRPSPALTRSVQECDLERGVVQHERVDALRQPAVPDVRRLARLPVRLQQPGLRAQGQCGWAGRRPLHVCALIPHMMLASHLHPGRYQRLDPFVSRYPCCHAW